MTKHTAEAKARAWTPERRAAQAERMRLRNSEPDFNAIRVAALTASPKAAAARVSVGKSMKGRRLSAVTYGIVVLHLHKIKRDPVAMAKMAATQRVGPTPKGKRPRYRQLRDLIGAEAAMAIVRREVAIAAMEAER